MAPVGAKSGINQYMFHVEHFFNYMLNGVTLIEIIKSGLGDPVWLIKSLTILNQFEIIVFLQSTPMLSVYKILKSLFICFSSLVFELDYLLFFYKN